MKELVLNLMWCFLQILVDQNKWFLAVHCQFQISDIIDIQFQFVYSLNLWLLKSCISGLEVSVIVELWVNKCWQIQYLHNKRNFASGPVMSGQYKDVSFKKFRICRYASFPKSPTLFFTPRFSVSSTDKIRLESFPYGTLLNFAQLKKKK